MAGKEFPLSLIIKAVDKATGPLRKVSERIGGLSKAATRVGKAMSIGVTAPLVGVGVASIAAFSKFESSMASVSTLIDTNKESLAAMGEQVLAIGKRTPVAIGDLAEALYEARSAGVSAGEQFKVLEGSARLAVAGLGTTKEAVDLVTSSINAFNLQGEDQARIYDLIFKTTNTGKTTISGLAQGFGSVAGTVASAGVKIDEFMSSVAALTTTGQPASQAYTQLRAVIAGLTRQTADTRRLFRHLGATDIKDLIAKSGGLVPALNRIKTALRGNDTKMLELVGSTEALGAIISLTGNQAGAFTSTLDTMRKGANQVDEAFEKQNKTGASTMQRLRNSMESIAISVGGSLAPALERLAPVIGDLADRWSGLSSGTQDAIIWAGVAVAALGPVLAIVGNLGTVFSMTNDAVGFAKDWGGYLWQMRASIMSGLVPSLTAATSSAWAFTASLLANPITWLALAVAGAAYLIYRNWDDIALFFKLLWGDIKEAFGPAIDWLTQMIRDWTPLGLIIKNWAPIKDFFVGLWDGIVGAFKTAWDFIEPIVSKMLEIGKLSWIGKAIGAAGDLVTTGKLGETRIFGSDDARPTVGADGAAPPAPGTQTSEARVSVDFANLPPGARVTPAQDNTAPLDLSMGYSMVSP